MVKVKRLGALALLALLLLSGPAAAAEEADAILGTYLNEKQTAHVEIFKDGGAYFGRIVWHKENRKDYKNPDPALQDRPLVGLVFLKDFVYDPEEKEWTDGEVYAPDDGKTYSGYLWLEDGVLKMRGYVGISLFGRTSVLTPLE
ncbi:MAG: DUF2147 domain-containing protein [Kiloniellales bacterium]|nr:DUF2147 domain-containing protein [Kiloniellales bacterium]